MNVFLFTVQGKITMMQTQITHLTNTMKQIQEQIDKISKEMEKIKMDSLNIETPSIYDEYFNENVLEPNKPSSDAQFVLVSPANNKEIVSESDSGSEYDSEY